MRRLLGIAVFLGLCAGVASAADMIADYTIGTNSQLLVANGGSGTNLFVDTSAAGGNDLTAASGYNSAFTVLIDGAGQWTLGDTVEITGFALQIQSVTASGTMTFDVLQGSGGSGTSGAGGLASLGTATATYTNPGANKNMYVNFDTPVSFVVDTNSFKIGINISNSGNLRIKAQDTFNVPRYNKDNGDLATFNTHMKVSVAGNVTKGSVGTNTAPEFVSDPFSKDDAFAELPYAGSLEGVAIDAENDLVSYSILSYNSLGTNWLGVDVDGLSLTGTPTSANIGVNEWTVQATDGNGGTNTATMTIEVLSGPSQMIGGYTVGSGLLSPNQEILFLDTAAPTPDAKDQTEADGYAPWFTLLVPGSNHWEIGDTVEITGAAIQIEGYTDTGIMTFQVWEAAGGTGTAGAGGLDLIGTAEASYQKTGSNDTMYVNFGTPVSFVADANSTTIGIQVSHSAPLRLKAGPDLPVQRYSILNGNLNADRMTFSIAGLVNGVGSGSKYDAWAASFGITNNPAADSDSDGIINLHEYALNGNPTNGLADAEMPTFGKDASGLVYVHPKRSDDDKLSYYLELTGSLTVPAWSNQGYTVIGTNVTGGTFDYVTNQIQTVDSVEFIRLNVDLVE